MLSVLFLTVLLILIPVLLIKKTRLKYQLALAWSRFPLLSETYKERLIEYGIDGLERKRGTCCRFTCCCRKRYDSDSESTTDSTSYDSRSKNSMVRNHYEMDEENYYEDISYSGHEKDCYQMRERDRSYTESSSSSSSPSEDSSYDDEKRGRRG